ncbi:bifunctional GNAT family N-acetyltransferase/NUDIX hydrolase [Streptomyces sp. DT2A-34]|uniref:bifunctional GNAT family N-acetyltransferase/NUDIX hydrolase n=1 Tax=Streptomyces sp. DT2A-34 TaxID=3051182 RepID=UPI00265C1F04|nr:bifunctional GNAT family N-acetyltransferase/NUDIX hydrolase [Streptomyces sp. DT2A-34]MDO0913872.1 bifunctional GNAT family N-acetyltransferase/NUDIX hydrolase [Streptomyces sp. DT2A-34]
MILDPLPLTPGHDIPGPLLTELTALYASNRDFHALSGDFPDPDDIRPEQVAAALAEEVRVPGAEVLLARRGSPRPGEAESGGAGQLAGIVITLARHPDPSDPDPWIGLLMVDAGARRQGYGRRLASLVEDRFRAADRTAVRLAVLDNTPDALAFWTALGYETIAYGRDRQLDRPCTVLRKPLPSPPRTPRRAARVAVLDPEGSVLLFRYDNVEVGVHWALPGGGLEADETPREGALRELREETGWTDLEPGPLLCTWEHDFTHASVPVRQHEHIYVTQGPHRDPTGPQLPAAHAADGILSWRWWTREELAAAPEPVWPPDLARLLDEWDAGKEA